MACAAAGGGVATGISKIVGAGPIGKIIAGVEGGLASRGRDGVVCGAVAGAMNNVSNKVSGTRTRTRGGPPNKMKHARFYRIEHLRAVEIEQEEIEQYQD